jgi:hypothetical protein
VLATIISVIDVYVRSCPNNDNKDMNSFVTDFIYTHAWTGFYKGNTARIFLMSDNLGHRNIETLLEAPS